MRFFFLPNFPIQKWKKENFFLSFPIYYSTSNIENKVLRFVKTFSSLIPTLGISKMEEIFWIDLEQINSLSIYPIGFKKIYLFESFPFSSYFLYSKRYYYYFFKLGTFPFYSYFFYFFYFSKSNLNKRKFYLL